jgi:hypothetical protein
MVQGFGIMRSLVWFFLLSWGVAPTRAAEVIYHWKVDAVLRNDLSPDCMDIKTARRTMFLVVDDELGPQFPGPLLEANEGDTIRVSDPSATWYLGGASPPCQSVASLQ